ncbi:MAG: hypothetical protein J7K82_04000, partial [Thermoproteales archaeon]|nr:hypothetical protein [Thermoproteales archaeon]
MSYYVKEAWAEFWASHVSKAGIALIIIMITISAYTLLTLPLDFGTRYWSNPVYWADYPKSVPPEWINFFLPEKLLPHSIIETSTASAITFKEGKFVKYYNITYNLEYN